MKVLVVDDAKSVHAYLKMCFDGLGYEIVDVFDGQEAVAQFESGASFDLVLLDWEMPNLTGIETLKKLREMKVTTPIIMLTSKNDVADIEAALTVGANEYVLKPFTKEILMDKLDFVMREAA